MENLSKLFSQRRSVDANFSVQAFVEALDDNISSAASPLAVGSSVVESVVSNESFSHDVQETVRAVYDQVDSILDSLSFESFNADRVDAQRIGENQKAAATIGLIGAQNESSYKRALLAATRAVSSSDANVIVSKGSMSGPAGTIGAFSEGVSLENYNEKSQRDYRVITAGYNLMSSRQDAFAEAMYRTTLINPQEGGAVQIVPYVAVMKDRFHQITGAKLDNQEVNLVDAYRDPSILEDESIALIPAIATGAGGNEAEFVDAADVAPVSKMDDRGNSYETAPLKFGRKVNLIGISNANQLIAAGVLTIEDTIDPAGSLKNIYVKVGGDGTEAARVIKFNVERTPTATFVPKLTGDTRLAAVSFESDRLKVSGETRAIDGSSMTAFDTMAAGKLRVELSLKVDGTISLSRGQTQFITGGVTVEAIYNEDGDRIDLTQGQGAALVAQLGELTAIGYDLNARFTNTNRRQRGQLLQTRAVQFRHPIWMHSPITLPLSTLDEQGPGEVAKALTVANDIRNSANAVTAALNYVAQLKEVATGESSIAQFGDVEGALSIMMRPTYRYHKLDLTQGSLDTIRSGDRWNDVTSAILNTIKGLLFPAYRDSNIESVFQTVSGNINEKPKFLICTDREIANYLQTVGDNRTLGGYLNYDVVATNNKKMDGKILVIPTRANPSENDILSWGQFFFVPPIVGDLPITRNGSTSREICAIPFNRHVNNIPFAIEIDVVGLRDAMSSSMYNVLL